MTTNDGRVETESPLSEGRVHDPRYLEFFECFNSGRFFEAHEVLEALWLPARGGPNAAFYQGLIQLAGAFVHLQKGRRAPAIRLLQRAREHFHGYPRKHENLDLPEVEALIEAWLAHLAEDAPCAHPIEAGPLPKLRLSGTHGEPHRTTAELGEGSRSDSKVR